MSSNMFTWSILFLLIFGFLIGITGIGEAPIVTIAYSNLVAPPEPIENISTIPFLNNAIYAGYLVYYGIMKLIQFVGLVVVFIIYANSLTFGMPVIQPIISLFVVISTFFIIFEIVKMFRGTS